MSTSKQQGKVTVHPYLGGTTSNMIANALKNGGVDKEFVPTFLMTLALSVATAPVRALESLLYGGQIERAELGEDPIFIVGHWRSGTTHLHNLVSQDKRLGYLTTLQAFFPTSAVLLSRTSWLKNGVAKLLPEKRMMDNMKLGLDLPQEEEFSLSCLTTSAHHCNHFPSTIRESFDKYVMFEVDGSEKRKWKRTYQGVIKKASFLAGGRRLVLKNPYNTGRLRVLLEMYPNAKFIHIYRNPYNIYVSAVHDFVKEAEEMALQKFSEEDFGELTFELYRKLMSAFWKDRELVPVGNLAEVAYEALEENPLRELKRIYAELGLTMTPAAEQQIVSYLKSIEGYKKNKYSYSAALTKKIGGQWGAFISRMKYVAPGDIAIDDKAAWSAQILS